MSHLDRFGGTKQVEDDSGNRLEFLFYKNGAGTWWIGICNACRAPLLVLGDGVRVIPTPQPSPVSEFIPESIAKDLNESKICLAAGAFNASVVMTRRALQGAAIEQGAPAGPNDKLWKQIAWLKTNGKITETQFKNANTTRFIGNDGAHPTQTDDGEDEVRNVDRDDASDAIAMVEALFNSLYHAAGLGERQRAKRAK